MSELMELLSGDFLPKFLAGMVVNFEIAAIALVIGLALGLLLAAGRLSGGVVTALTVSIIALMRAAPTFVIMFFLLNAIPRDATLFGAPFALSGVMTWRCRWCPTRRPTLPMPVSTASGTCAPGRRMGHSCFFPTSPVRSS